MDEIIVDLNSTMESISNDVNNVVPADMKTEQVPEDDAETTPFNKSEQTKISSNSESITVSTNLSKKYIPFKRDVENKKTPNSIYSNVG